ncbi:ShlB/FhaC/HecB family hemolysin secretion/activation protein [Janthinobacterium fluminis]|uniref:ShlB/FhaC/HecB family hemolysin secretion/activation protein n=1 Tax=Janthinobacterium fluminis TaxID=2987524 RepID=A0ABT5JTU8_9BURK|nr:ShlB/FhaC/HecB family hemolysin secretion/activation protein [Janthinobacterium fluminis]MDC8756173.1 ShlB/FhaC/HecB family hemolysin secretion/activation protein [Janthinobacterium fluminis]
MASKLFPLALLAVSQGAFAVDPPGAGSQIQQVPPVPLPQKRAPEIRIQQGAVAPAVLDDHEKILVKRLRVEAGGGVPEAELLAATGFQPDSELTLAQLRAMAAKVADLYHSRGYFLAQAFLPAQDIEDGGVTIAVLEGRYGNVSLRNSSRVADGLAGAVLGGLGQGEPIATAPLERRLLLLSDMPGVEVRSTLVPGASVGASDLIVEVVPGSRVNGSVDADNQGNRYTGTKRVGATLNVNELLGYADVATVRAFTSAEGLNYARLSYQGQFGLAKGGLAYTAMHYRLGEEFASLEANGTARIASVYGSYPLIRSRNNSLYAQLNYDSKRFQDKADVSGALADKHVKVWMANLNGDRRGSGGASTYSLTWTSGKVDIRSAAALAADQATVGSNGHFDKWSLSLMHLHSLAENTSLFASLSVQMASKNLDISEKMGLGGVGAVRAYPGGEGYADQGYVLSLELRRNLPDFGAALPGQLQALAFVDTGTVSLNKHPWAAGENRKTLSGAGLGLTWMGQNGLALKLYYAHKLGGAVATSAPDSASRVWLQAVKYF